MILTKVDFIQQKSILSAKLKKKMDQSGKTVGLNEKTFLTLRSLLHCAKKEEISWTRFTFIKR